MLDWQVHIGVSVNFLKSCFLMREQRSEKNSWKCCPLQGKSLLEYNKYRSIIINFTHLCYIETDWFLFPIIFFLN